jgi:hypothetical protein
MKKLGKTQSLKANHPESGFQRVSTDSSRFVIDASAAFSDIDECPFENEFQRQQSFGGNSNLLAESDQKVGL